MIGSYICMQPPFPPLFFNGQEQPQASETSVSLAGKRVVTVEDEGITQMQLQKTLKRAGLVVVGEAMNGQEGVEIVLRERPDLVLMDIKMPVMDGLEAARRILAEYRVCIIMLTAFSEEQYQQQARQMGACGYILKPISSDTLLPQMQAAYQSWREASTQH